MTTVASPVEEAALSSDEIIPAVRGEFYAYTCGFSAERPLYFLLKCKANKARPLTTDVEQLLQELDLTFIFSDEVLLCSPSSGPSTDLLRNVLNDADLRRLNKTEIRLSALSTDRFHRSLEARSGLVLVDAFHGSEPSDSVVRLSEGMTLSVRTASNKYALIRLRNVTVSACTLEASHILL